MTRLLSWLTSPGQWKFSESKGGAFYMYAGNNEDPIVPKIRIGSIKDKKRAAAMANAYMIAEAVNEYKQRHNLP